MVKLCTVKVSIQRGLTYNAVGFFGPQSPRYIESLVYIYMYTVKPVTADHGGRHKKWSVIGGGRLWEFT